MNDRRVVVIGSGPSGAMAAHELVRLGIPVTVLEAGSAAPSGFLLRARGRNLYRKVPPPGLDPTSYVASGHPSTTWLRNLAPGGLSNQWTGAVPRFAPGDFFEGERLDRRYRWPIDYVDLVPSYRRAERLLRITACPQDVPGLPAGWMDYRRWLPGDWQSVAAVAARRSQGLTPLPLADGPKYLVARQGTAFNSFTGIIRKLQLSPCFELRTGSVALRLEWSAAKRRVDAITYYDRTSATLRRLEAEAVIVACGPLDSTRLLFNSTCADFPEGLGNSDGNLGFYLHDHPREWWSLYTTKPISRLAPAGYLTRRPYDVSEPMLATSWTIGLTSRQDQILSFTSLKGRTVGVQVFGTMIPSRRYFARPNADIVDEFGLPQLEIHLDFEPDVVANMEKARGHFLELLADAGYPCELDPVVPQLAPGTAVHYGGTARMHRSREFGVVDEWNRIFDVPNVLVTDAGSFTTSSEKNPTLTAMAISARAAEHLAWELRHGKDA